MTTAKRVLVVGGTGNLGGKIVRELLALAPALVRVTTRDPNKAESAALAALGVELATADLGDAGSLERACDGIDVVVSAAQGLADIIVDGQTRLLRAAEVKGVARMLPSDYALDFFKTTPGKNRNLDLRRDFNTVLDGSTRVRGTSVLCGAFMDLITWGAIGPDPKTGVYRVWGSPDQRYDFTLTDDLAKYIAAIALDDTAGRFVRVAGDSQTARTLAPIFEAARGTPVTIVAAGTLDELDALIERMKAEDPSPGNPFPRWQQLQYTRDMAGGAGVLEPLDNARFPAIVPVTVRDLLARPRR
jgi:uncharacterized protein YbjT (DUF2867 family)